MAVRYVAVDFSEAVLLGVLQGLAEWLPVSSEGLVSLASKLFFSRVFDVALASAIWLHVGTLFSAVVYLRKDVSLVLRGFVKEGPERKLLLFIACTALGSVVSAVPALVMLRGLAVSDSLFTASVGAFLILTGLIPRRPRRSGVEEDVKTGLLVGLVQGFSIIPGISRSGVTVSMLLLLGANVHKAFRLSYLMSIPVVAGGQILLPLFFGIWSLTPEMLAGALAAFAVGLLTMKLLLTASAKISHRTLMVPFGSAIFLLGVLMGLQ
ncbi:MAG: undecaprenyl-diphosphate phosphatase [Candidatus Caldarchaeum sp.]|nr:undecaprenyl-diphosphate phosphatase [Candidatus Caldarchaeum sp.]